MRASRNTSPRAANRLLRLAPSTTAVVLQTGNDAHVQVDLLLILLLQHYPHRTPLPQPALPVHADNLVKYLSML